MRVNVRHQPPSQGLVRVGLWVYLSPGEDRINAANTASNLSARFPRQPGSLDLKRLHLPTVGCPENMSGLSVISLEIGSPFQWKFDARAFHGAAKDRLDHMQDARVSGRGVDEVLAEPEGVVPPLGVRRRVALSTSNLVVIRDSRGTQCERWWGVLVWLPAGGTSAPTRSWGRAGRPSDRRRSTRSGCRHAAAAGARRASTPQRNGRARPAAPGFV